VDPLRCTFCVPSVVSGTSLKAWVIPWNGLLVMLCGTAVPFRQDSFTQQMLDS
jgi:hypothetical protein